MAEKFSFKKLFEGFSLFNPIAWSKRLVSAFWNIVIYGIIISIIFVYGYTIGNQNLPIKVELGYGREAVVNLGNKEYLWIQKSGEVCVIDNANPLKAKVLRIIKVKDLGALKNKLSPIGVQFVPIGVVGYGMGIKGDGGIEAGVGVSFFRYFRGSVEAFLTQKGVYVGTSYRLDKINMTNTSIGIAVGTSYKDFMENYRIMIYASIRF